MVLKIVLKKNLEMPFQRSLFNFLGIFLTAEFSEKLPQVLFCPCTSTSR